MILLEQSNLTIQEFKGTNNKKYFNIINSQIEKQQSTEPLDAILDKIIGTVTYIEDGIEKFYGDITYSVNSNKKQQVDISSRVGYFQQWTLQTFQNSLNNSDMRLEDLYKYGDQLHLYGVQLKQYYVQETGKNISFNTFTDLLQQLKNSNIKDISDINFTVNPNKFIMLYKSLRDLNIQLDKYKEKFNIDSQEGHKESNISEEIEQLIQKKEIYEVPIEPNSQYRIFIPLNQQQQKYVGKDTDWCTQRQKYSLYADCPLFQVRNKTIFKDNYQFYFGEKSMLMDNSDTTVDSDKFSKQHPDILRQIINFQTTGKYLELYNYTNKYKDRLTVRDNIIYHKITFPFIKNPTEENKKLWYVKKDGLQIQYIENPTKELQLQQIRTNHFQIQYIENPSEEVQLQQVTEIWVQIKYIKNPSEEVQLQQVRDNGTQIRYIINPTKKVQLQQVRQHASQILYIDNPSEEVQFNLVINDVWQIRYIENPTEKVQLQQIDQNEVQIYFIKNVTDKVIYTQFSEDTSFQIFKNKTDKPIEYEYLYSRYLQYKQKLENLSEQKIQFNKILGL